MLLTCVWLAQAVQVKNSIHFSSSLLRITLHKFQKIWWKFTMNSSKVKRQSYNMIFVSNVSHSILARRVGSPDIHPSNFQNLSFSRWYSRHTWQTSFQCVPSEFMDDKRPILEQFVWYPNFLHRNEKYGLNVMKSKNIYIISFPFPFLKMATTLHLYISLIIKLFWDEGQRKFIGNLSTICHPRGS